MIVTYVTGISDHLNHWTQYQKAEYALNLINGTPLLLYYNLRETLPPTCPRPFMEAAFWNADDKQNKHLYYFSTTECTWTTTGELANSLV